MTEQEQTPKPKPHKPMKIKKYEREKLTAYLKQFYSYYPSERYTIFHFVKMFKSRLKMNKDAWIAVCGDTSTGKSYFVLMAMVLFGRPMNMEDNVAYIPKGNEIMEMFDKLNFQCLLIDEAAREMRSVNWQSKQQQGVNMKAMTDRFKNNMIFLNMPSFNEFTKSMRRGNLQFRVIMPYRTDTHARVIVQRKSRNWRSDDAWGDKEADEKYEKYIKRHKELDNEGILRIERSLPNTIMDFMVPNLMLALPEVTDEYERLKEKSREVANEDEYSTKVDKYKKEYEMLLYKVTRLIFNNELGLGEVKVTKTEMAKALGMGIDKFNKFLKNDPPPDEAYVKKIRLGK